MLDAIHEMFKDIDGLDELLDRDSLGICEAFTDHLPKVFSLRKRRYDV